jgi:UPF0271 protein
MASIDLCSDLGESYGMWRMGDDAAMLDIASSANVACGFHAGDPLGILTTLRAAAERGVAVGAHVSYPDKGGFGRRYMDVAADELTADVMYQISALQGLAKAAGTAVTYVKPHGALYNTIVDDEGQARAVVDAIAQVDPALPLLGLPGSAGLRLAAERGIPTRTEAFADRGYTPAGALVSRREPGAVLHDPDAIAARMVRLVTEGALEAADGSTIRIQADSICVHGDSPGAVQIARAVRAALNDAGIGVEPFTEAGRAAFQGR